MSVVEHKAVSYAWLYLTVFTCQLMGFLGGSKSFGQFGKTVIFCQILAYKNECVAQLRAASGELPKLYLLKQPFAHSLKFVPPISVASYTSVEYCNVDLTAHWTEQIVVN